MRVCVCVCTCESACSRVHAHEYVHMHERSVSVRARVLLRSSGFLTPCNIRETGGSTAYLSLSLKRKWSSVSCFWVSLDMPVRG